jgi:hypothetical protein
MLPTRALFLLLFWGLFTGCQQQTDKLTPKKIFKYNQPEALSSLDPAFARNQANIWATT